MPPVAPPRSTAFDARTVGRNLREFASLAGSDRVVTVNTPVGRVHVRALPTMGEFETAAQAIGYPDLPQRLGANAAKRHYLGVSHEATDVGIVELADRNGRIEMTATLARAGAPVAQQIVTEAAREVSERINELRIPASRPSM